MPPATLGRPAEAWVDVPGLLRQAREFELAGHIRAAEAAYDAVIVSAARQDDHPALAEAFRRRAIMAHHCGDSSRARAVCSRATRWPPCSATVGSMAETLNALGGLELETRNLAAAEAALSEALDLAGRATPRCLPGWRRTSASWLTSGAICRRRNHTTGARSRPSSRWATPAGAPSPSITWAC